MKIDREAELSLSHNTLLLYLHYCPTTGIFTWKMDVSMGTRSGTQAGNIDNNRVTIRFRGIDYYAHRLAWFYVHAYWPKGIIDHIDRNSSNNRIDNLRDTNYSINNQNKNVQKRNISGHSGVTFIRSSLHWRASIRVNKKLIHLGCFASKEMAIKVRQDAEKRYG